MTLPVTTLKLWWKRFWCEHHCGQCCYCGKLQKEKTVAECLRSQGFKPRGAKPK